MEKSYKVANLPNEDVIDTNGSTGIYKELDETSYQNDVTDNPNFSAFRSTLDGSNGKFRSLSIQDKARVIKNNITIEPFLFVTAFAGSLVMVIWQSLVIRKFCLINLQYPEEICSNLTANTTLEKEAQNLTANFNMYKTYIETIPMILMSIFLGSWSDRYGRKMPLLLPVIGHLLSSIIMFINAYYEKEIPPLYMLLSAVPSGLSGGMVATIMSVNAYISDISTRKTRTVRFAFLQVAFMTAAPIGISVGGVLFKAIGYIPVFGISIGLYILSIIYLIFYIKDTRKPEPTVNDRCFILSFFDLARIKESLSTCLKKRENNGRLHLFLLFITMCIGMFPFMGEMTVMYMYTRLKFQWDEAMFSYYSSFSMIIHAIGLLVALPILTMWLKISDPFLGLLGTFTRIGSEIIIAFSVAGWMMFLASVITMFNGVSHAVIRSMMSKLIPNSELGKTFAVMGALEAIVPLFSGTIYTQLYRATYHYFPGAIYLLSASIIVIPGLLFLWIYWDMKRRGMIGNDTRFPETDEQTQMEETINSPEADQQTKMEENINS